MCIECSLCIQSTAPRVRTFRERAAPSEATVSRTSAPPRIPFDRARTPAGAGCRDRPQSMPHVHGIRMAGRVLVGVLKEFARRPLLHTGECGKGIGALFNHGMLKHGQSSGPLVDQGKRKFFAGGARGREPGNKDLRRMPSPVPGDGNDPDTGLRRHREIWVVALLGSERRKAIQGADWAPVLPEKNCLVMQ